MCWSDTAGSSDGWLPGLVQEVALAQPAAAVVEDAQEASWPTPCGETLRLPRQPCGSRLPVPSQDT